jgi:hypothetical protein
MSAALALASYGRRDWYQKANHNPGTSPGRVPAATYLYDQRDVWRAIRFIQKEWTCAPFLRPHCWHRSPAPHWRRRSPPVHPPMPPPRPFGLAIRPALLIPVTPGPTPPALVTPGPNIPLTPRSRHWSRFPTRQIGEPRRALTASMKIRRSRELKRSSIQMFLDCKRTIMEFGGVKLQ